MYAKKFVKIYIEDILDDFCYKMNSVAEYAVPNNFSEKEWEKVGDEIDEILTEFLDSFKSSLTFKKKPYRIET